MNAKGNIFSDIKTAVKLTGEIRKARKAGAGIEVRKVWTVPMLKTDYWVWTMESCLFYGKKWKPFVEAFEALPSDTQHSLTFTPAVVRILTSGQPHLKIWKSNGKIEDMEIERLKTALTELEDPRRTVGGHILHKLEDIIIIGLCTLLCNGEDFTDSLIKAVDLGKRISLKKKRYIAALNPLVLELVISGF